MINLEKELQEVSSVAVLGHVRPDGDCIGSCLAVYHYIRTYFPQIEVNVYLEEFRPEYLIMKGADKIIHTDDDGKVYDLCISLDSADRKRHGNFIRYFDGAKRTIGVDHHVSNAGFADEHLIEGDAAATAEVLYELIGRDHLTKEIAESLYLALSHDTGIFQYSNTTPKTLRIAADFLEMGIDASTIIDVTFYQKTYEQHQILGKALMESIRLLDDQVVAAIIRIKDMENYGVTAKDLSSIVSQLRYTKGAEVAVFIYELEPQQFKVSMRSNGRVDVNKVASYFGGGGHVKAAGCELSGNSYDVLNNLLAHIETQLEEKES